MNFYPVVITRIGRVGQITSSVYFNFMLPLCNSLLWSSSIEVQLIKKLSFMEWYSLYGVTHLSKPDNGIASSIDWEPAIRSE